MSTTDTLEVLLLSEGTLLEALTFPLPKGLSSKMSLTVQRTKTSTLLGKRRRKGSVATSKRSAAQLILKQATLKLQPAGSAAGADTAIALGSIAAFERRKRIEQLLKSCGSSAPREAEKQPPSGGSSKTKKTLTSTGKPPKRSGSLDIADSVQSSLMTSERMKPGSPPRYGMYKAEGVWKKYLADVSYHYFISKCMF